VASVQAGAAASLVIGVPAGLFGLLGLALWKARDRTAVLVPWSTLLLAGSMAVASTTDVELGVVLPSLVLFGGEVMVLAAVALLFSSFSTPFLTGAFTFGVWLVGRSADDMATMTSRTLGPEIRGLLRALAEVWPNFHLFVPGRHTLLAEAGGMGGPWAYVAQAMGYGLIYAALVLGLAMLIFRRRDFL
jgi:Cu-processing system permease protein